MSKVKKEEEEEEGTHERHTYRLRLMSLWQHLIQLRFELHILRRNADVYALRSVYPGKVKTRRNNGNIFCHKNDYHADVIKK